MLNISDMTKIYNLDEVAGMLSMSIYTLRKKCREGKVQHGRDGRIYKFTIEDINTYKEGLKK